MAELVKWIDQAEGTAVDLVAKVAPWASPLPTAYLTARATVQHLGWPEPMGIIAGVIVECLGLAATATALTLREYNCNRQRKSDPTAPLALALVLVGVYFGSITLLTVLLDTAPALAVYAPLAFPILSLSGVTVLALRADHRRRLAGIEAGKAERQADRQAKRQGVRQAVSAQPSSRPSNIPILTADLDRLQAGRKAKRDARLDALLDFYVDNPLAGPTEAGRAVGVSRQTVHTYLDQLEQLGKVARNNGDGVQVLTRG